MLKLDLDDDYDLELFGTHEYASSSSVNKAMMLIMNMQDLGYIDFDSEIQTMQFTNPGIQYLKNHGNKIKYYIEKNNITLQDFGPMVGYMEGLFKNNEAPKFLNLSAYPILDCDYKLNELGEVEMNMNNVVFKEKAPGDLQA